jgi:hypothetical protein
MEEFQGILHSAILGFGCPAVPARPSCRYN